MREWLKSELRLEYIRDSDNFHLSILFIEEENEEKDEEWLGFIMQANP